MREILFRGKRADNENWVKGLLVKKLDLDGSDELCIQTWEREKEGVSSRIVSVIPSTVGQFTGLTDKNGTKIFEGDIVKSYTETYTKGWENVEKVEFFNGAFGLATADGQKFTAFINHSMYVRSLEVIGNIHDNPELLEVKQ